MKKLVFIYSILFCHAAWSQNNIDDVLSSVEQNNKTLVALRQNIDADKLGNKTGIFLDNPEVGFNYLWGSPAGTGNRTDITVSQSFDFPTAYSQKKQISNLQNVQLELEYIKSLKSVQLQTRMLCYDLIYVNALMAELQKRLGHAETIAKSYKSKFDAGDANILDYNKSQLNLLNLKKEIEILDIEKAGYLAELSGLNGGMDTEFHTEQFILSQVPVNFEDWYLQAETNSPVLSWLKQQVEIDKMQEKLNKSLSLPGFEAGYMSEKTLGEHYQGLTFGMTVPLWQNKNTVKYEKAKALAVESEIVDVKTQMYYKLKALHAKAYRLQKSANKYNESLILVSNSELLNKALDNGEISLIEYVLEHSYYYESVTNLYELQQELAKTLAEMKYYSVF